MVATYLLLGLVLIAAITDLRQHKIYNWTTYPGIVAALAINAAGYGIASDDFAANSATSRLVSSPIAETTTATCWPAARLATTRRATASIRSGSATLVPPYFWTIRPIAVPVWCSIQRSAAPEPATGGV